MAKASFFCLPFRHKCAVNCGKSASFGPKKHDQFWSCFFPSFLPCFASKMAKYCCLCLSKRQKDRQKTRPPPYIYIYIYICLSLSLSLSLSVSLSLSLLSLSLSLALSFSSCYPMLCVLAIWTLDGTDMKARKHKNVPIVSAAPLGRDGNRALQNCYISNSKHLSRYL